MSESSIFEFAKRKIDGNHVLNFHLSTRSFTLFLVFFLHFDGLTFLGAGVSIGAKSNIQASGFFSFKNQCRHLLF